MALPFQHVEAPNGGGLLRGRGSVTLCAIENLFAAADGIRDVTSASVAEVCEGRRVDLAHRLSRGRRQLYARYLRHCFEDRRLTDQERADLAHLRKLLHLSAEDLNDVHNEVAIEVYGEVVEEVLADFQIDDDEASFLGNLRSDLGLADDKAEQIEQRSSAEARLRARTQAESRDMQFIAHHAPAGEFTGRSEASFDAAVEDALARASLAIPKLHWFEVIETAGYVSDGKVTGWHVTLRAGIES